MNEYEFHLGALIAEKRNQAGISKKQLAELCGYTKIAKGIRRVGEIERGKVIKELTAKIMQILDISNEERESCKHKDYDLEMERRNNLPPFKPYIVRRLIAAVYQNLPVPEGMSHEELIENTLKRSVEEHFLMCLQLDYDLRYWMNPNGTYFVDRTFEGGPWARPNIGIFFK